MSTPNDVPRPPKRSISSLSSGLLNTSAPITLHKLSLLLTSVFDLQTALLNRKSISISTTLPTILATSKPKLNHNPINSKMGPLTSTHSQSPPPSVAEAPKPASFRILIRVCDMTSDGPAVDFRVKPTTPLSKLMNAYCENQEKALESLRFFYDGMKLKPDNTPEEVGFLFWGVCDIERRETGTWTWTWT